MKYQLIMHRLMEPGKEPDITLRHAGRHAAAGAGDDLPPPGQAGRLRRPSYVANGHVLDADPHSLRRHRHLRHPGLRAGSTGTCCSEKQFPHHTASPSGTPGASLFDATRLLGVDEIYTPQPASLPYASENPFPA